MILHLNKIIIHYFILFIWAGIIPLYSQEYSYNLAPKSNIKSEQISLSLIAKNWVETVNPYLAASLHKDENIAQNPIYVESQAGQLIAIFNKYAKRKDGILIKEQFNTANYVIQEIPNNPDLVFVKVKSVNLADSIINQDLEVELMANNKLNGTYLCRIIPLNDIQGGVRKSDIKDQIKLLNNAKKLPMIENIKNNNIRKEINKLLTLAIHDFKIWEQHSAEGEKIPLAEDIIAVLWDKLKKDYFSKEKKAELLQINIIIKHLISFFHKIEIPNNLTFDQKQTGKSIADLYFAARIGKNEELIIQASKSILQNYESQLDDLRSTIKQESVILKPMLKDIGLGITTDFTSPSEDIPKLQTKLQAHLKTLKAQLETNPTTKIKTILEQVEKLNKLIQDDYFVIETMIQLNQENQIPKYIIETIATHNGMMNIDFCIDYALIKKTFGMIFNSIKGVIDVVEKRISTEDISDSEKEISKLAIHEIKSLINDPVSPLSSESPFYKKKKLFELTATVLRGLKNPKQITEGMVNLVATMVDMYSLGSDYRTFLSQKYIMRENGKASRENVKREREIIESVLNNPLELPKYDTKKTSTIERLSEIDSYLNVLINSLIKGTISQNKAYRTAHTLNLFFKMAVSYLTETAQEYQIDYLNDLKKELLQHLPETQHNIAHTLSDKLRANPSQTPSKKIIMVDTMTPPLEYIAKKAIKGYIGSISKDINTNGGHFMQVSTKYNHAFDLQADFSKKTNNNVIAIFESGKTKFILNPSEKKVRQIFADDAQRKERLKHLNKLPTKPIVIDDNYNFPVALNLGQPACDETINDYLKRVAIFLETASDKNSSSLGLVRTELLFDSIKILKGQNIANLSKLRKSKIYKDFLTLQTKSYITLLNAVSPNQKVTIRTWDLAQDKELLGLSAIEIYSQMNLSQDIEELPEGLDFTLSKEGKQLFEDQISCLLEAALETDEDSGILQIMFPKVYNTKQIEKTFKIIENIKTKILKKHENSQDKIALIEAKLNNISLGIMLETKNAALTPNRFKKSQKKNKTSFFSIGSNDLNVAIMSEYLKSHVSRSGNNSHSRYASGIQLPTVKMILKIFKSQYGKKTPFPIGLCGELGGDVNFIALLASLRKLKKQLPKNSPFYLPENIWSSYNPSFDPGWNTSSLNKLNQIRYYYNMIDSLGPTNEDEKKILSRLLVVLKTFSALGENETNLHDPDIYPELYKKQLQQYDDLITDLYAILNSIVNYWNQELPNFINKSRIDILKSFSENLTQIAA